MILEESCDKQSEICFVSSYTSDELESDDDVDDDDEEYIMLSKISQADIIAIVEQLVPDAPLLKDLLSDQLRNSQCSDKRGQKWSKSLLSMCLGQWAK